MNSQTRFPRPIELLAPARNAATAFAAIDHGADAVYMGPPQNGARAAAANSLEDIAAVADYAHKYGARVYATVNTIIYDSELKTVERMIGELYRRDVDAIIVQDMAVLRMDIPPIALHASTQCDIRTPERAVWLESAGFSQIVPARELTVEETAAICAAVSVPVEVFVHGALCVSYSGDCYASFATTGRSANRGECSQVCRLPFTLRDGVGNVLIRDRHLLSLRDLNRSGDLGALLEAGVSSLKFEGRLKDEAYVKNVVAAYRRALDGVIEANPGLYARASSGKSEIGFVPDLSRAFNRGFTSYFTHGGRPQEPMACLDSPKHTGAAVARVKRCEGTAVELSGLTAEIANGDGLGYFDPQSGVFSGFRVNRAQGSRIFAQSAQRLKAGTVLYRNFDKVWEDTVGASRGNRRIDIALTLRMSGAGLTLDAADGEGHSVTVATAYEPVEAKTPQRERHADILGKTGDTVFGVSKIDDRAEGLFVPASRLTALRRQATDAMSRCREIGRPVVYRTLRGTPAELPEKEITYEENVANALAAEVYRAAGAESVAPALEVCAKEGAIAGKTRLMTTRYCLRRECGRCLRTPDGAKWRGPLSISSGKNVFRLEFDCGECRMHVLPYSDD